MQPRSPTNPTNLLKSIFSYGDVGPTLAVLYGLALAGVSITWAAGGARWTNLIWALACVIGGTAIGFLFGIPKIEQAESDRREVQNGDADQGGYRQRVNTNLTDISDWLTKIIVGLGLINLRRIPDYVDSAASTLASAATPPVADGARAFALGLIISFSMLGFLFGYLVTRLFLAGAFSRADQESLKRQALTELRVRALESDQGLVKAALYPDAVTNEVAEAAQPEEDASFGIPEAVVSELLRSGDAYMAINAPDWGERVRQKDEAANRMAAFILGKELNREAVLRLATQTKNEGIAIALATVINSLPRPDDLDRLLMLGSWVRRKHVQYRIVTALGRLYELGFVAPRERAKVLGLLHRFARNADGSLAALIETTMTAIGEQPRSVA